MVESIGNHRLGLLTIEFFKKKQASVKETGGCSYKNKGLGGAGWVQGHVSRLSFIKSGT